MCVVTSFYHLRRTIITPIASQSEYTDVDNFLLSLNYRRFLKPPSPVWSEFLPWDSQGNAAVNVFCFPIRLFVIVGYVIGLVCQPLISFIMILCCPLVYTCHAMPCTNGFLSNQHLYYELELSAMAAYPIDYTCLDEDTARVFDWLRARGVIEEQCMVVDGVNHENRGGCVSTKPSKMGSEEIRQAHVGETVA